VTTFIVCIDGCTPGMGALVARDVRFLSRRHHTLGSWRQNGVNGGFSVTGVGGWLFAIRHGTLGVIVRRIRWHVHPTRDSSNERVGRKRHGIFCTSVAAFFFLFLM
jgi:hypothetical protein